MRKLLSLTVILVLVAWGAYKGAVWWYADQTMAELRRSLSDHGALERGSISSGVSGELILEGTRFQSFRLTQPLVIRRLHLMTDSPLALLQSLHDKHDLPRSWRLEASDWRLPLDTAMLRNWVTDTDEQAPRPLFMPVCGPDARQQLGSGDLIRMGLNELAGDAQLRQSSGGVRLEVHTRESGGIDVFWEGARLRLDADGVNLTPAAERIQIALRDGGMMRRITAYCARETGLPAASWADLVMTSFREGLESRGLQASPQLMALYRQWLTEGGELVATLDPKAAWPGIPVRVSESAPGATRDSGSPSFTVSYNGAAVPDVYLSRIEPVTPDVPEQALEPVVDPEQAPVVAGWQVIAPEQAADWLGYTVRVTLSNGRNVEGRLTRIDDQQVEVARPVDGGEVAYPMALRAVDQLAVWRRGQRADD
ncbi:acetylornithine deacetylase [Marinobacter sp.]|uniref:acetylornithine deacetylase n=1 Tax=Marinobacter sp. TaxID=50741 RepID=UPI00356A86A2